MLWNCIQRSLLVFIAQVNFIVDISLIKQPSLVCGIIVFKQAIIFLFPLYVSTFKHLSYVTRHSILNSDHLNNNSNEINVQQYDGSYMILFNNKSKHFEIRIMTGVLKFVQNVTFRSEKAFKLLAAVDSLYHAFWKSWIRKHVWSIPSTAKWLCMLKALATHTHTHTHTAQSHRTWQFSLVFVR